MDAVTEFLEKKKIRADEYLRIIEQMLMDERYEFAFTTLCDIMEDVVAHNRISDKQAQAILNIRNSK